jgi:hypothetical protein
VQDAAALMARFLAQMTESAVGFIDQDQGIRICHNAGIIETISVPKLIHIDNPISLLSSNTSRDDSRLRNCRASARVS